MEYRRVKVEGGTFFFTQVTYNRRPFLCKPENIFLLRKVFRKVIQRHPFTVDAIVILPNHLHCIWTLPPGDDDFSRRWRLIKSNFTRLCHAQYKGKISPSRQLKKEQAVWQRRFWEHQIRDEFDFQQHVDYIHYNPVRHGYVMAPKDWQYSSFHRYVTQSTYTIDWGVGMKLEFPDDVGRE
ncbi:transposase [Cronbergia sp. UHCC 0137]|uniref:REP-associated tyrosine transposase n=1 Tax=Cronbergia sp. UHCC 0137 TaxID=3110239 RepID=UPI002B2164F8|nr:transposase [Cronbergia sp. UHCC 0137]MEA5619205.1 transposase [Cronbergia sp. UHCC 0137]